MFGFDKQEGIVLIHYMAHARRKFSEALGNDKVRAEYALSEIQRLYAIERHIRDKLFTGEEKKQYRKEYSLPLLEELKGWMINTYPTL